MEWIGFVEPRRQEDEARVKQSVCEIRDEQVDQPKVLVKEDMVKECPLLGQEVEGKNKEVASVVDNY